MLSILRHNIKHDPLSEDGLLSYGMPPYPWVMFQDINKHGERLQFIGGHFGLADLQKMIQLEQQLPEPRAIEFLPFTIMRDPNERLVSFWAYLNDLHSSPNRTIEAMLDQMLPNSMYRLLAPADCDLSDEQTTLRRIQDSFSQVYALVGLTERFEETLLLLKRQGILQEISFRKHKVLSSSRPTFRALPVQVQQRIIQHNRLDQQLYDFAVSRFETLLSQQDESFRTELEEFKQQQQRRLMNEGECEDDYGGGWKCDPKDRKRKRRVQKRNWDMKEKQMNQFSTEDLLRHVVDTFIHRSFKPRYW